MNIKVQFQFTYNSCSIICWSAHASNITNQRRRKKSTQKNVSSSSHRPLAPTYTVKWPETRSQNSFSSLASTTFKYAKSRRRAFFAFNSLFMVFFCLHSCSLFCYYGHRFRTLSHKLIHQNENRNHSPIIIH